MNKLLASLPEDAHKKLRKKGQPSWTLPMLATLIDERFSDPDWICERKLDGERVLAFRDEKACDCFPGTKSCSITLTLS
jgi:ATP-dependent DNA ligase